MNNQERENMIKTILSTLSGIEKGNVEITTFETIDRSIIPIVTMDTDKKVILTYEKNVESEEYVRGFSHYASAFVIFSDPTIVANIDETYRYIFNVVEDVRVQTIIQELLPGTRKYLKIYRDNVEPLKSLSLFVIDLERARHRNFDDIDMPRIREIFDTLLEDPNPVRGLWATIEILKMWMKDRSRIRAELPNRSRIISTTTELETEERKNTEHCKMMKDILNSDKSLEELEKDMNEFIEKYKETIKKTTERFKTMVKRTKFTPQPINLPYEYKEIKIHSLKNNKIKMHKIKDEELKLLEQTLMEKRTAKLDYEGEIYDFSIPTSIHEPKRFYLPQKQRISMAATIMMDGSGSVQGFTEDTLRDIASNIENILIELGANIRAISFEASSSGYTCYHHVFRDFDDDNENTITSRMYKSVIADYENADGYSIRYELEKILDRPEKLKIIMFISDGLPHHGGCAYSGNEAIADTLYMYYDVKREGVHFIPICCTSSQATLKKMWGKKMLYVDSSNIPTAISSIINNIIEGNSIDEMGDYY
ncbi:MAG: hypothetical protein ACTSRA_00570 [Promethearchaeota archaeon]|nr:MAG: von Willebrand factor A-like protein [Helarchaeota virus Nidhogg Meg22_1012]URC17452.1 MAG: von Willebrand factor A-like protein [Helarchaeota virus Nidhogg Meg22_1214]